MSVQRDASYLTPEEYLGTERKAEGNDRCFAGEVFGIISAGRRHSLILANAVAELRMQLEQRACKVCLSDMRVKVARASLYTNPDVVGVCDEPRFEDEHNDTLLNPTVIVEALSSSTEAYSRGKKYEPYRQLDSLCEYLLMAQDAPRVEQYLRQPGSRWPVSEAGRLEDVVQLASIQCKLALLEIYSKVEFEQ